LSVARFGEAVAECHAAGAIPKVVLIARVSRRRNAAPHQRELAAGRLIGEIAPIGDFRRRARRGTRRAGRGPAYGRRQIERLGDLARRVGDGVGTGRSGSERWRLDDRAITLSRSTSSAMRFIIATASTGNCPAADSADSITASALRRWRRDVGDFRSGRHRMVIIDSSICVATTTGLPRGAPCG